MSNTLSIEEYFVEILSYITQLSTDDGLTYKNTVWLSVYEDLYGTFFFINRYRKINFNERNKIILHLEQLSIYNEGIFRYRKLMEHLCYLILIEDEWGTENHYKLYVLSRLYDNTRRSLEWLTNPEDSDRYNDFMGSSNKIITLLSNDIQINKITKEPSKWCKKMVNVKELIKINPFRSFKDLFPDAKILAAEMEKKFLANNYEDAYGLCSWGIHSNPLSEYKLNFNNTEELQKFINQALLGLAHLVSKRVGITAYVSRKINV